MLVDFGAALAMWYIDQNNPRKIEPSDSMQGSYLGPNFSQSQIEEQLKKVGANFEIMKKKT